MSKLFFLQNRQVQPVPAAEGEETTPLAAVVHRPNRPVEILTTDPESDLPPESDPIEILTTGNLPSTAKKDSALTAALVDASEPPTAAAVTAGGDKVAAGEGAQPKKLHPFFSLVGQKQTGGAGTGAGKAPAAVKAEGGKKGTKEKEKEKEKVEKGTAVKGGKKGRKAKVQCS